MNSILPFYSSIDQQAHRKDYAYGAVFPLIAPSSTFMPFRLTGATSGASIIAKNLEGQTVKDVTSYFPSVTSGTYESPGEVDLGLAQGQYYLQLGDMFSEVFTVVKNVSEYLKIDWWSEVDSFKNTVYIDSQLGKPEYPFTEEGEDRDGYFFVAKQISEKKYKFTFLAPEYLLDAMRLARMADNIHITDRYGTTHVCDTILLTPKWQTQGNIAGVEVEFETATAIKKLGLGLPGFAGSGPDFEYESNESDGGGGQVTIETKQSSITRKAITRVTRDKSKLTFEQGPIPITGVEGLTEALESTVESVEVIPEESSIPPTDANVFSALRSIKEITTRIGDFLVVIKGLFLRKDVEDSAAEKITFEKGIQIGEEFSGGMLGYGGYIDPLAMGTLEGLTLRSFLEAPEYRFNRIQVVEGETILTEHATVEDVESLGGPRYRIYPKLVDGDVIAISPKSLLKGLFHEGFSFSSTYLIVDVVDNTSERKFMDVTMADNKDTPTGSNLVPKRMQKLARVGHQEDAEKQRYVTISSVKGGLQIYDGASDFMRGVIVGSFDIAQDFKHKYPNLPVQEGKVYAYLQGLAVEDIIRINKQGVPIRETHDRGKWKSGVTYYNNDEEGTDSVWHNGSKYIAFSNSTTSEPSPTNPSWILVASIPDLGDGDPRMEIDSSNGTTFIYSSSFESTLTAKVLVYMKNITEDVIKWSWTRQTGDDQEARDNDLFWNENNKHNNTNTMEITKSDIISGKAKFICDATVDNQTIRGII